MPVASRYTSRMAKKITLATIAAHLEKIDTRIEKMDTRIVKMDDRMERGFAAVAEDIGDIRTNMATKDQIIALHTQVSSIESELRGMKRDKLVTRVADLEEEAFGGPRG